MKKVFLVVNKMNISYLKDNYSVSSYSFSKHLKYDRLERFKTYLKSVKEFDFISAFIVNKKHKNGLEVHAIDKNGFIVVFNFKSKKIITVISATPYQIERYYKKLNSKMNDEVLKAIKTSDERNKKYNFNNI